MAANEQARRNQLVRRIRRVQWRLNGEVWLQELAMPLWLCITAISLYRFTVRSYLPLIAAAAFGAMALVWFLRARRRWLSFEQASVIADRQSSAGGLLLSRLEVPVGDWELQLNVQVRSLKMPAVKVGRALSSVAMALLLFAVMMLIPLTERAPLQVNSAAASKVSQVEAKAEALALEEPLEESLQEELARLREELADGRFDAPDWEAADGVESALEKKAAEAAAELSNAAEAARSLEEAMANGLSGEATAKEREALEQALLQLSDGQSETGAQALSQSLGKEGDGSGNQGDGGQSQSGNPSGTEAQNQSGNGKAQPSQGNGQSDSNGPSKNQVSDLRKALEKRQQQLANAYGQQRGQSASRQQGRGQGQGQGQQQSGKGQQGGQGQGQGQGKPGDGNSNGHASRNVQGGPSRGGGEGELVFGDWAEMNPERLKFEPLPKGQGGEVEDELYGLRAADPKATAQKAQAIATGSFTQGEQAPSHKAGPQLPRNQELIKRYFEK